YEHLRMSWWRFALSALIPALWMIPSLSLAQDFGGSLAGTVSDPSGGRIPFAAIVLRAFESSIARQASTNSRGEFRFDDLLPGAYNITVDARGFARAESPVTIVVASVRHVAVTMNPALVQQAVNVRGQASSI